jgi:hypothetical protein
MCYVASKVDEGWAVRMSRLVPEDRIAPKANGNLKAKLKQLSQATNTTTLPLN